ncbi:MAG TPA: sigma-54 dependent transcriptional regulator [Candidatus Polarisedimenticolia bacterium]|jgi:DNA-binding NtrC family response regulator|nr:sigma-54 dependent transcriptional regulator [Candidatus Polarisedimenticolia bacterium]
MKRLLIVEDERISRENLQTMFSEHGYDVEAAPNGGQAIRRLDQEHFDLVITDMQMPEADGLQVLRKAKQADENTIVMVMTAYGSVESAVEAMRFGAYDYIQKPFELDELEMKVMRAFDHQRETRQLEVLKSAESEAGELVSESAEMKQVLAVVQKVARSKATVLITGETGTGKEKVAEALHQGSWRAEHNLVKVNCAAIPEDLIESELFGHERGAFTGALRRKMGRFELADEGTLFLDEVGSMSPRTQAKLLRALQDQEFERVGGERSIRVDVRVVAATNRDLLEAIDRGEFRSDLFHRLSVVNIRIPPLRERKADIQPLATIFLEKYSRELHRSIKGFTEEAKALLLEHPWSGNVRELKNAMERTVLMSESDWISPEDISLFEIRLAPRDAAGGSQKVSASMDLEEMEKEAVLQALERANWVQKDAAAALGISSRVMNYKVKKYSFKNPRWNRNKPTAGEM